MNPAEDFETFRGLLTSLISKYSKEPVDAIEDDTPLDQLGVDSIDIMEIVFELEEKYGLTVDNEEVLETENFITLCKHLFDAANEKASA